MIFKTTYMVLNGIGLEVKLEKKLKVFRIERSIKKEDNTFGPWILVIWLGEGEKYILPIQVEECEVLFLGW